MKIGSSIIVWAALGSFILFNLPFVVGCGCEADVCRALLGTDCNECEFEDCPEPQMVFEFCGDGLDNDFDGLIDCADPDCESHPTCAQENMPGTETDCNNDFDDDGDGLEDCCDPDCAAAQICEFFNGTCP